ncbi:glycoside hydrolase family 6 protein [Nocardioides lianchengensis]|uniref:glycoside hydrolase family 6 protein n=1 Tax=Nocardioides lianchengensis TaxID=1045774 RepID=UPI00147BD0CA|nr:glycoside hydrolase family 6 protein [Nocardioides lianchengensis]NYG12831.1 endoglucanase [Nocardioides lianchengensis]
MDRTDRRPSRLPRLLAGAVVLVLVAGVALVTAARSQHWGPFALDPQLDNPFLDRPQYVEAGSSTDEAARQAAADGDGNAAIYERLAKVPQGIWLTPEDFPRGQVGDHVAEIVKKADDEGDLPVFVVYGIPDRDCTGGFSAGGLSNEDYGPWVDEIARAAGGGDAAVVVLEPDALASAIDCDNRSERVDLIAAAVDSLREAGVTTYVDGGHSSWIRAGDLAPLLKEVGVDTVRGFATNVSNFQTDADERAFADELVELLGGDVHYVIDRGRNGNGASDEWCNPSGRAFGDQPGYVDDSTRLDAYLWVKPPGESDGECNGGPAAGGFWAQRVQELAAASGW